MTLISSADKIRALMSPDPTQKLDISHLFRERAAFEGSLSLALMSRISDMLEDDTGEIVYQIQFNKNDENWRLLDIRINTSLKLLCQRCLKPVVLDIERDSTLIVVATAKELEEIDGDFEPLVLEEAGDFTIQELIQDELLLALPSAPTCDMSVCEASDMLKKISAEGKTNPFAVLESLKKKTN